MEGPPITTATAADPDPDPGVEVGPLRTPAPIRVLLIDDAPDHAALAAWRLTHAGLARFLVTQATTAEQATAWVQLAEQGGADGPTGFDAVVVDYHLIGIDGLTLLDQLRAGGLSAPALLLTGQGSEAVAADALRAHVDDYLQKEQGLIGDALARAVLRIVERHRLAVELARAEAEAGRLEGIRLTAIHLADVINNQLAAPVAFVELLRAQGAMPAAFEGLGTAALTSLHAIAAAIRQLHGVTHVETRPTPVGEALDPTRSSAAGAPEVPEAAGSV
jgi:CheY-like chemotaxis protein